MELQKPIFQLIHLIIQLNQLQNNQAEKLPYMLLKMNEYKLDMNHPENLHYLKKPYFIQAEEKTDACRY